MRLELILKDKNNSVKHSVVNDAHSYCQDDAFTHYSRRAACWQYALALSTAVSVNDTVPAATVRPYAPSERLFPVAFQLMERKYHGIKVQLNSSNNQYIQKPTTTWSTSRIKGTALECFTRCKLYNYNTANLDLCVVSLVCDREQLKRKIQSFDALVC